MEVVRCGAVSPVDRDHFFDFGVVLVLQAIEVTRYVRASIVQGQKVGVLAGQDRIPAVDSDPVYVHPPAPGHRQPAPPGFGQEKKRHKRNP